MVVGALGIVMFNLVDTFFVGRLGAEQLAAMSFTFPIVLVAGSVAAGLGVGASSTVSRALGAGDRSDAIRLTTHAQGLAFIIVLSLALAGLFPIEPMFTALGAPPTILPFIRDYMVIWYIGMPFVVLPMVGQNVLQATGDTRVPAMIITGAVTLNMILDPVLIFGWGPFAPMGIRGAAVATVIARGSTLIVVWSMLLFREHLLDFRVMFDRFGASARRVLFVGLPAAATNIALPLSMGIVTRLVAGFGPLAVAGFGVATRVESFALIFTMALAMVFTPFVGQNSGAGRLDRVRDGFAVASVMSIAWGTMAMVVFLAAGSRIAGIFSDSAPVVETATRYLRIVSPSFGVLGVVTVGSAAFNGVNRPLSAAGLAFTRLFLLFVPLALIGRAVGGITGLFTGLAVANVIAGAVAWLRVRSQVCHRNGCVDPD
jgi:putative MATE family efflux protein